MWRSTKNTNLIEIIWGSNLVDCPDQSDVFALDHDFSQRSGGVSFGSDFIGFIEYDVHELIKAKNFTLQSDFVVIEEPYLDTGLVLQKSENDCQGVDTFWLAFFGHSVVIMVDGLGTAPWILYKLNINPLISY